MKKIMFLFFLVFMGCSNRITIKEPFITPTQNSQEIDELIEIGITLHDAGKYEEAIEKYDEAIKQNPNNPMAYYEKSYSLMHLQRNKESLNAALKASEFNSGLLYSTYIQLGNCLDISKYHKESELVYEKAFAIDSSSHLLYYNMGITKANLEKFDESRDCFKKGMIINPLHTSSHFALGNMYMYDENVIPAILAYSRFLSLEQTSQRSGMVLMNIQDLLNNGYQQKSENEFNIFVPSDPKEYDGNFLPVFLQLAAINTIQKTDSTKKELRPIELLIDKYSNIFQIMLELKENQDFEGFVWEYYAPYFIEMQKKDLVEPFVYYIFQIADDPEIQSWIQNNKDKINKFINWNNSFNFNI